MQYVIGVHGSRFVFAFSLRNDKTFNSDINDYTNSSFQPSTKSEGRPGQIIPSHLYQQNIMTTKGLRESNGQHMVTNSEVLKISPRHPSSALRITTE